MLFNLCEKHSVAFDVLDGGGAPRTSSVYLAVRLPFELWDRSVDVGSFVAWEDGSGCP